MFELRQLGLLSFISVFGAHDIKSTRRVCVYGIFMFWRCVCVCAIVACVGIVLLAQDGRTALIWAAIGGHADCVRLLLDAGADRNAQENVV